MFDGIPAQLPDDIRDLIRQARHLPPSDKAGRVSIIERLADALESLGDGETAERIRSARHDFDRVLDICAREEA